MSDMMENKGVVETTDSMYFAPLLPWQRELWSQLTQRVLTSQQSLPHALLAAGMQGMGKRAFVWRFVAWLLCHERDRHPTGACTECESCQWLKSGTHPSLQVLPIACMPNGVDHADNTEKLSSKATDKKNAKAVSSSTLKIKVDDIRALQPFIYQGGQGMRICVLDHAEQMTVAAANALLKTLEEPQAQVHLFLMSDAPAQLLPTIKSRVQQLALQTIESTVAVDYVTQALGHTINREAVSTAAIEQLIQLANGAPLAAIAMAQAPWYDKRALWLTTWQALRSGKRSSVAASDYWQNQLDVKEFIQLSEMMLLDLRRVCLGLSALQNDVNLTAILDVYQPADSGLVAFASSLQEGKTALQQNVQEKFVYDKLMQELASL
ncbi:MAG: DNA polymerase III subunit delta' [Psychrobacter sp.]|jgi:DNA polymerase-3 subunit delta'|uniref:DNA polymerase III subunit delta' n=1 Tax=Psychrobacter TaxID=497 RepID=UPI000EC4B673|nr:MULTISPECIES: DNA polymerase III subunit delta' [Psychrobacter]MCD1279309.1 DNA polymerase III subunit delta' [Psychrobacter sp. CCUG 69069]MCD6252634.1 DNA polymerase III subunit delta' [Psychrobacter sp.]HCN18313.1 DNA polymerase III subunit delta' [Psychrobacter sp.]|tara:strand:- start:10895 stop:12031 length:1137 start_codon:yes stop_codon:yes gene_type:complete